MSYQGNPHDSYMNSGKQFAFVHTGGGQAVSGYIPPPSGFFYHQPRQPTSGPLSQAFTCPAPANPWAAVAQLQYGYAPPGY